MTLRAALLLVLALPAGGCVTYDRGVIAAAASSPLAVDAEVMKESVEGRACTDTRVGRYESAVELALRQAPGANALMDVSYSFERFCIVVRGTAVRMP